MNWLRIAAASRFATLIAALEIYRFNASAADCGRFSICYSSRIRNTCGDATGAADCGRFSICYSEGGSILGQLTRTLLRIAAASRFATVEARRDGRSECHLLRIAAASRFATVTNLVIVAKPLRIGRFSICYSQRTPHTFMRCGLRPLLDLLQWADSLGAPLAASAADCGRFSICYSGHSMTIPSYLQIAADCGRFSICYSCASDVP